MHAPHGLYGYASDQPDMERSPLHGGSLGLRAEYRVAGVGLRFANPTYETTKTIRHWMSDTTSGGVEAAASAPRGRDRPRAPASAPVAGGARMRAVPSAAFAPGEPQPRPA